MGRIKDYCTREWNTFKSLDKDGKKHFLWDYYKIPIGVLAFILIIIVAEIIYSQGSGKVGVYVVMINSNDVESSLWNEYLEKAGIGSGYHADVNTLYRYDTSSGFSASANQSTIEVLATLFGIGDLDIFVAEQELFDRYAVKDAFEDLSLVLGEEYLAGHEDDLYTYTTEDGYTVMGGIWLRQGSLLHQAGYYSDRDVLIGVAQGAQNLKNALEVMKVILGDISPNFSLDLAISSLGEPLESVLERQGLTMEDVTNYQGVSNYYAMPETWKCGDSIYDIYFSVADTNGQKLITNCTYITIFEKGISIENLEKEFNSAYEAVVASFGDPVVDFYEQEKLSRNDSSRFGSVPEEWSYGWSPAVDTIEVDGQVFYSSVILRMQKDPESEGYYLTVMFSLGKRPLAYGS